MKLKSSLAAILLVTLCSSLIAAPTAIDQLDAPLHFVYTVEYHTTMSERDFARIQSQVSGRPEHPSRRAYKNEQRRRTNGPDQVIHDVWADSMGIIRYNTSNTADDLYVDVAQNKETIWSLSGGQLTLVPNNGEHVPDAPELDSMLDESQRIIQYFLSQGMSLRESLPVGEWQRTSDHQMIATGNGIKLTHQTTDKKTTISVVECEPSPEAVGLKWVLSGTVTANETSLQLAQSLKEYAADGSLDRRIVLNSIEPVDSSMLKLLAKPPAFDGEDIIRGESTFLAIYDYRPSEPEITVQSADGTLTISASEIPDAKSLARIRFISWIAAGVIAASLLFFRIRTGLGRA